MGVVVPDAVRREIGVVAEKWTFTVSSRWLHPNSVRQAHGLARRCGFSTHVKDKTCARVYVQYLLERW